MSAELEPAGAVEELTFPVQLYRSKMLRRWGLLYYLSGLAVFFRRLAMTEPSAERVRQASEKGPVVYALRTRSEIDYLALNEVLRRRRLPLAAFGTGVKTQAFLPVVELLKSAWENSRWWLKHGSLPNPVSSGFLQKLVLANRHTAVFLRRESDWLDLFRTPDFPDPIAALLEAQANSDRPVQVLPVAVIWRRPPDRARTGGVQAVLGTSEDPGSMGRLLGMALGSRRALVQIGEPVDLADYLERFREEPPQRQAKRLRLLLRRYCYREQELVRGPRLKSPSHTKRLVLRSKRIERLIQSESDATGQSVDELRASVLKRYDKMAARFSYPLVQIASTVVNAFWTRIYSGIDVREEDIERIRQATREGVCVLAPCHKSHIDYMLLSTVLHNHDIVIPHVVAGENLSFFPLGILFRRLGAFFIKRTFRGDRIFPTLFEAYLAHLMREGYTTEFFIEGGRSRTGKLLTPRIGVLGLTVNAGIESRVGRTSLNEVSWLPVSISYERVAEEAPYARELSGEEKRPESLSEVVKAGRVLFKRYGKVYVRVGEPWKLTEFLDELPEPWETLDEPRRKAALTLLGERILGRIGAAVVALPTGLLSLALLAQSEETIEVSALEARVARFRVLLNDAGAEPSRSLMNSRSAFTDALRRFLREGKVMRLPAPDGGQAHFQVVADQRITLEYYKNSLLHFLLPAALLASELRASERVDGEPFEAGALRESFEFQLFVFRFEFVLDPDVDWDTLRARGLSQLALHGAITELADGRWAVADTALLSELAELVLNFQESYCACLRALHLLQAKDIPQADLAQEIRGVAEQLLAVAELSRPEALNLVNLKNAAQAFADEGLYQFRSGGAGLEIDRVTHREYLDRFRRLILR